MAVAEQVTVVRRLERGDGETFAHTASAPVLFGVLALGVALAALALGRIGASAAAERGAYAAGTAAYGAEAGTRLARRFFDGFTGAADAQTAAVNEGRMVRLTTQRAFRFGAPTVGRFETTQDGAMRKRMERFYPGGGED